MIGKYVPARYVFTLVTFLGVTLVYCLKVSLSVAIVAMVKATEPGLEESDIEGTCSSRNVTTRIVESGELNWTETTQGYVLSAFYYGDIITMLLGGRLADRYGPKVVVGPGVFLTGLFAMFGPIAARWNVGAFIAVRALQGAAAGVLVPGMNTLFARWFPPLERPLFSGIIFSAIHVGTLLSMSLSGMLAAAGRWSSIFYFFGTLTMLWYVLWIFLVYDSPEVHPRISPSEKEYIQSGLGGTTINTKGARSVPWRSIMTSRPVWAHHAVKLGYFWVFYIFLTVLPMYLKNMLKFNIKSAGAVAAMPYLFCWFSSIISGFLSQWLQRKGYLSKLTAYRIFDAIAMVGPGITLVVLTQVGCDTMANVGLLLATMTANGAILGGSFLNNIDLSVNYAGTIAGITATITAFAGIIAPIMTGAIIDGQQTLGRWHIIFYISSCISTLPLVVFLLWGSVEEQPWNNHEKSSDPEHNSKKFEASTHM